MVHVLIALHTNIQFLMKTDVMIRHAQHSINLMLREDVKHVHLINRQQLMVGHVLVLMIVNQDKYLKRVAVRIAHFS